MRPLIFIISVFVLLLAPLATTAAQTDSLESYDENETDFRMSVGLSGGLILVNPSQLNDQIAFANNSFDANMDNVRSMMLFAGYIRIKPRLSPFLLMRIEALTVSRSFDYTADGRSSGNTPTGTFNYSGLTRWSIYPIVIGIGTTIPKTPIEAEVGAMYALGYITDESRVAGGSPLTTTSSGDGWGFQGRIAPHYRFSKNASIAFEISYRFLVMKNYSDNLGRNAENFQLDLNGISVCFGLLYTLQ